MELMRGKHSEPDRTTGVITVSVNINLLDECEAAFGTLVDVVKAYDREASEKGGAGC